jgi:nucleoid-associated protein YgaU
MAVFPGSRYQNGEVLTLADKNGVMQLSVYRGPVIVGALQEYVVLRQGTRLDQIAQVVYGDPTLWWVIADANQTPDGYFDNLPAGTQLRIPDVPPSS